MTDTQDYLVGEMLEHYRQGQLSRREMLRRVVLITGSIPTAAAAIAAAGCAPATNAGADAPTAAPEPTAAPVATTPAVTAFRPMGPPDAPTQNGITVPPNTPGLEVLHYSFSRDDVIYFNYIARPAGTGRFPVVIVIHENRGLVEHIRDVARRFATNSYAAMAVDLVSPRGGTASMDPAQATGALGQIPAEEHMRTLNRAIESVATQPWANTTRGVGVTGYCFGGGMTWRIATENPRVIAAAPYYGPNPPLNQVPNIKAEIEAAYAENDPRINAGIPQLEEALRTAGVKHTITIYPGAGHAFNNDTGPSFQPAAAKAAWSRTIALFDRVLKA